MESGLEKRIIIIGGGFSGIGALKRLDEASNFKVTLLEASGSLGGRINTVLSEESTSAVLELGATFIHGEEGNSLYQIAHEMGMVVRTFHGDQAFSRHACLMSNGERIDTEMLVSYGDLITDIFREIAYCCERNDWSLVLYPEKASWSKPVDTPTPDSISDYVTQRFKSITSDEPDAGSPILDSILDHWLLREAVLNGTSYSSGVDVLTYNDFSYPSGDVNILLSCGYQGLIEAITTEISSCCEFNKRVCRIDWTAPSKREETTKAPVLVHCDDGSSYSADHVIVTVSLGVLQDSSRIVFDPPLPTNKRMAISKIGMGLVSKVILTFPNSLIPDKPEVCKISLLWREKERLFLSTQYPWVAYIYRINRINDTNSWTFWFAGEEACQVEALSDNELSEGICVALDLFLQTSVQRPSAIQRTKWGQNHLFRGSYSFTPTGSGKAEREELARPINGVTPLQLLFAGEATHSTNYSTTNGAYDTGIREADRLINLYTKN